MNPRLLSVSLVLIPLMSFADCDTEAMKRQTLNRYTIDATTFLDCRVNDEVKITRGSWWKKVYEVQLNCDHKHMINAAEWDYEAVEVKQHFSLATCEMITKRGSKLPYKVIGPRREGRRVEDSGHQPQAPAIRGNR